MKTKKLTRKEWNKQWREIEQENLSLLTVVRNFIRKEFGGRCNKKAGDIAEGCLKCQMWAIYDILKTHLFNRPHRKKMIK